MKRRSEWYRLDNAAKMIPASTSRSDTRVFRLSCELTEEVDPDLLQDALEEVVEEFPFYNCVLMRGVFWYYLEESDYRAVVTEENIPACDPLYYRGKKSLLYRVNYFGRRINLEMFHVLADGTGGMMFLKRLVALYLRKVHGLPDQQPEETSSAEEKESDAFDDFYEKQRGLFKLGRVRVTKAYQITGKLDENLQPQLVEGVVSAGKLKEMAAGCDTTIGVLLTALYIESIIRSMKERSKNLPIVVSVPVNLRQYFPSATTRNFFGSISVSYQARDYDGRLESVIQVVKDSFADQLTEEHIGKNMNSFSSLERSIALKMVPLTIKDFVIRFAWMHAKKGITSNFSNLGRITMPEDVAPYVDYFSAFMATNTEQVTITSFGDKLVFGEASPFVNHEVMMYLFRRLTSLGIDVVVSSNGNGGVG